MGERDGVQAISEAGARFSVVDHYASCEPLSRGLLQFSQTAEVGGGHRSGRFDLHSSDLASAPLEYDVHLHHVLVAEMVEADVVVVPTRLIASLLAVQVKGNRPADRRFRSRSVKRIPNPGPVGGSGTLS